MTSFELELIRLYWLATITNELYDISRPCWRKQVKAIRVKTVDGEPKLKWEDVPDVTCDAEEVLVNIRATAVNRADLSQAMGFYPPPPGVTNIIGLEMAGEIVAIGDEIAGWEIGDRVCALLAGGGYSEQVAVHQGMLLRLPVNLDFVQGAAVPEVWYTAFINLFIEGELRENESVLIHAGGSGVGTASIQLARQTGAKVFITAGSAEKLDACTALGADFAINYKEEDFLKIINKETGGVGVELILDPVGGTYLARNISVLKQQGRLVSIGLLGGNVGELDMAQLLRKRLRIRGSTLRYRSLAEKISITGRFRERYWPLFQKGTLRPVIDSVFPIFDAQLAHDYVRQNKNIGKVVLTI
jgi:putative PIG3 family NAD(P)H quinone oxidoreductase